MLKVEHHFAVLTSLFFVLFSLSCSKTTDWLACGLEDSTVEIINTKLGLDMNVPDDVVLRYKVNYHENCVLALKYWTFLQLICG